MSMQARWHRVALLYTPCSLQWRNLNHDELSISISAAVFPVGFFYCHNLTLTNL
jgi:hypothetical protein